MICAFVKNSNVGKFDCDFLSLFCQFASFSLNDDKYSSKFDFKWKKQRWCAWASNPGPLDGRHRQIH